MERMRPGWLMRPLCEPTCRITVHLDSRARARTSRGPVPRFRPRLFLGGCRGRLLKLASQGAAATCIDLRPWSGRLWKQTLPRLDSLAPP